MNNREREKEREICIVVSFPQVTQSTKKSQRNIEDSFSSF